jgi:hypothetical protein
VLSIESGESMKLECSGREMTVHLWCVDSTRPPVNKPGFSRKLLRTLATETVLLDLQYLGDKETTKAVIWTVDDDPISENLNLAQIVGGAASVAKDCLDEGYWIAQRYREQQGH